MGMSGNLDIFKIIDKYKSKINQNDIKQ